MSVTPLPMPTRPPESSRYDILFEPVRIGPLTTPGHLPVATFSLLIHPDVDPGACQRNRRGHPAEAATDNRRPQRHVLSFPNGPQPRLKLTPRPSADGPAGARASAVFAMRPYTVTSPPSGPESVRKFIRLRRQTPR
jgi:hypothetical protein